MITALVYIGWYGGTAAAAIAAFRRPASSLQVWLAADATRAAALIALNFFLPTVYRDAWTLTGPIVSALLLAAAAEVHSKLTWRRRLNFLMTAALGVSVVIAAALCGDRGRDVAIGARMIIDTAALVALWSAMLWRGRCSWEAGAMLIWLTVDSWYYTNTWLLKPSATFRAEGPAIAMLIQMAAFILLAIRRK